MSKSCPSTLYTFSIPSSPNSCNIKIQNLNIRALIDTGSELTLISEKVYNGLNNIPALKKCNIALHSASGSKLQVLGNVTINIKLQGLKFDQEFIVVRDLTRSAILGRDFLVANSARLYFDLGKLRIRGVYIPMEKDIHLASSVYAASTITLRPQTSYIVVACVNSSPYFPNMNNYSFTPTDRGFVFDQPEIKVSPALVNLRDGKVPIQITNTAYKTVRILKGIALGFLSVISEPEEETREVMPIDITDNDFKAQIKVDNEVRSTIEPFLFRNRSSFAFSDNDLTVTDLGIAEIDTGNSKPINLRPYRIPLSQREEVSDTIDNLLEAGLISRSNSPWNFPIVLVEKKADQPGETPKKRMCVDFRALNQIVDIRSHPIPLIDDILSDLKGSTYFTTLDLRSGFYQIPLSKQASEKCAFSCFKGKYQYNVMPFGLNNAPSIFQRVVNELLQGCEHFAMAYIDDILIHTKGSIQDHMDHVQLVIDRLQKHKLKLKLSKCQWAMTEIKYLGFIVNRQGIKPCGDKVKAIRSLRPPETVRQVRGVLGMASYYRRFIPNFAAISEPLVSLTKKHARFRWNRECQVAFDEIKEQLTKIPLLAYPDPAREYILYTDASDTTIGSVLVQEAEGEEWIPGIPNEKPIYFLSHKLSPSQIKSYSTIEKELFAIHFSLNKLHFYLHNARFTIKTDHQPLKYLFTAPQKNRRCQSWAMTVNSYNCKIEYLRGKENVTADLLSRSPPLNDKDDRTVENKESDDTMEQAEVAVLNSNHFDPADYIEVEPPLENTDPIPLLSDGPLRDLKLREEQEKDPEILEIKRKLEKGGNVSHLLRKYLIKDEILYYISQVDDDPVLRVFVPGHLRDGVLKQYHDDNGHMAVAKTFLTMKIKYYWPRMYKELDKYIGACSTCKERNLKQKKSPVQDTGMPPFPMAALQLDLSGPHRKTMSGNIYIATFICLYSGWFLFFSLPDKSAQSILECLLEHIVPRHGCPLVITTDNGSEFNNQYFRDTLSKLNVKHIKTSTYSPRSNGAVERSHRTLNDILSKLMGEHGDTWDLYLSSALAALRTNVSKTTLMSPFKLLYNRDPVLPLDNLLRPRERTHSEEYHELAFETLHKSFLTVLKNSKRAKESRNRTANKKRSPIDFKVGDPVFLKNNKKTTKLDKNWLTHHYIVERLGPVSFRVRNQLKGTESRVHADALRLADVTWKVPKFVNDRPRRRARLVASPPTSSSNSSNDSEGNVSGNDSSEGTIIYNPDDWEGLGVRRERKIREDSESELDIPEFELKKCSRVVGNARPFLQVDSGRDMSVDVMELQ